MALLLGVILPAQAQPLEILHTFTNTPDGSNPLQLAWTNGLFYGSTANGGSNGDGCLFTFDPNAGVLTQIYAFTGADNSGESPNGMLVTANAIYGTAEDGGTNGYGMVYAANTNGTGFTPLYSFGLSPDGEFPESTLVLSGTNLYGTTTSGGSGPAGTAGTVFRISTNGLGYAVMHSFTNMPDGVQPEGGLVLSGNTLYGTTSSGGAHGFGSIFAINTDGSGYTNVYSFSNAPDAKNPAGGLVLSGGILYGTSQVGGSNNSGAIFAINTNGAGYQVLYNFSASGNVDGKTPKATLSLSGSCLYGTTTAGGAYDGGTLFLINTNGTAFTVIQSFTETGNPLGGAIRVSNSVWGTTYQGGPDGSGFLYRLPMPAIITQPQNLSVASGSTATFSVYAADDSAMTYAWYFNTNTLLGGQNTNVLTLANATNGNAGAYTVVISDAFGAVTSSPAVLVVTGTVPAITQNAQNYTVTNGYNATFTNLASGSAPLFYEWFFNTNTLVSSGDNEMVLTISPAGTNQAGYYTAIVTNAFGSATSAPALLTVIVPPSKPTITQNPQNYTVTNGYDATFTNVASGSGTLFYQWYFNTNTAVAGGTNAILQITFATTNQAGYYSVVVSNAVGSVTSSAALLTVISTAPFILTQPQPTTTTNGEPFTFSVVAAGKSPLKYQWYTNSVSAVFGLLHQTNSSITFPSASNNLAGNYLVVVTNSLGKATSSPALLTVLTKPVITQQPQNAGATIGGSASFTAGATGAGTLAFQWYFKTNTPVVGATNTSLTFPAVSNSLAGFYDVRVTNSFGAVTSGFALLSIYSRPDILSFAVSNSSAWFTITNLANSTNRLWASTNLAPTTFWNVIGSNVMTASGVWLFTDTNSAKTNVTRFYRASSP